MLDHDARSYALIARVFDGQTEGLTRDDILDNITLYWLTNTAVSSARLYWESKLAFFAPKDVPIPVAVSAFPDEIYTAPRSWAERAYPKLIHYNRLPRAATSPPGSSRELFTPRSCATAFRSLRVSLTSAAAMLGAGACPRRTGPERLGACRSIPAAAAVCGAPSARRRSPRRAGARPRSERGARRAAAPSFGPLKQIDAGVLERRLRRSGPRRRRRPSCCCTAGPTTSTASPRSRRCWRPAGYRVIVPVSARLRHDALPLGEDLRNGQQAALALDAIALDGRAARSTGRSSPASTGARARPTSSPRSGRSAARRWSRSAAT